MVLGEGIFSTLPFGSVSSDGFFGLSLPPITFTADKKAPPVDHYL